MIQDILIDKLKVQIYENRHLLGADAARNVAEKLKFILKKQNYVNIIFAAAPSQQEFLTSLCQEEGVDWDRINAYHMDEYIGLQDGAPQLFGNFLKERIFDKVSFHNVHYINGNRKDEVQRYSNLLKKNPPDIICMGIGENSHIAFNDPHVANFNDPYQVKIVRLDSACRQQQVNEGCFKDIEHVPEYALTLTIPALLQAKYIYCIVPGVNKAQAIYNTLNSEISEDFPSTILRNHTNAILYLDKNSSAKLSKVNLSN
jgi:glucosamine-6-phosphate deaminase